MSEIALYRAFLIIFCVTSFAILILVFGTLNKVVYKLNIVTKNEVLVHDGSRLLGLQLQSHGSSIPRGQRDVQVKDEGNKPWLGWLYTASREQFGFFWFFSRLCSWFTCIVTMVLQTHHDRFFPQLCTQEMFRKK